MRKIYLILISALFIASMAGCNFNDNSKFLNQSITKIENTKSYHFAGTSEVKENGQQFELIKYDGYFQAPDETYTKNQITYQGSNILNEIYQKGKDDFYEKTNDKWEKANSEQTAAIKQSEADKSPIDFLKIIKQDGRLAFFTETKLINGKKYKVIKINIRTDKLREKTKKTMQANISELDKSEDKSLVQEQKKQMDEFLKNLNITEAFVVYIDSDENIYRVDMNQNIKSVINKEKNNTEQLLTIYFDNFNQPVKMPVIDK